ncbi:tautomerase family protein [uncultured Thalassospira sp.]|uniref:tautomerase family protein n=1 Tax=uncultured Thalassospira sp. TaxID=404382 RepID=UPI0030DD4303
MSEHVPGEGMIWPDSFLGITHDSTVAFVQITCTEGRSVEQKKALFAEIAANLARVGVTENDVIINLVETARENWSFGNGLAPFA